MTAAPLVIECGIPSEAGFFGAGDEVEVDVGNARVAVGVFIKLVTFVLIMHSA